jgi:hypothetical protein
MDWVVQLSTLSLPTRVVVELGCDNLVDLVSIDTYSESRKCCISYKMAKQSRERTPI